MSTCPIEDRLAIEDLLIAYCHAVDSLSDIDGICAVFTEDADYDLSGIGFPHKRGHAGIREFFAGVFAGMAHHAHYLTNFAVTAYAGETASARAYIIGMGAGRTAVRSPSMGDTTSIWRGPRRAGRPGAIRWTS